MQSTGRMLILALGNPLREDDGIGAAVLQSLQQTMPDMPGVDLLDGGTAGLDCALLWEGYSDLILIDAADMGLRPGEWRKLSLDDMELDEGGLHTIGAVHAAGLKEALVLGRALGNLPNSVTVFGVQPDLVGYGSGISAQLEEEIPALSAAVLQCAGLDNSSIV